MDNPANYPPPPPMPPPQAPPFQVPQRQGLAIASLVIGIISLITCGGACIGNMQRSKQAAYETAAISELKTLESAEATYQLTKGNGSYGDLSDLGVEGIIDSNFALGIKEGYRFEVTPFTGPDGEAMYNATAVPISPGKYGTGSRSFATNETNVIYEAQGAKKLEGTPRNRVPAGGRPLQ